MKNLLIVVLFLIGYANVNAQDSDLPIQYGVKAGVNFSDITGDNLDSFTGRTAFHIGGIVEIPFCQSFSIQPELLYSAQGSDFEEEEEGYTYKGEATIDYLNLPIMAKYYVGGGFSLEAGPQLGLLLSAKAIYEVDGEEEEEDLKDDIKSIDFGLNFGLGYKFDNGLNLGARYNLGITDANEGDLDEGASYKNSVIQFSLGYFF